VAAGATAVVPAYLHTCGLSTAGTVACWGSNTVGELGIGVASAPIPAPVPVVGLSEGAKEISASWEHTCALTRVGAVKCWGWNEYGALGDGTTTDRATPVEVTGLSGNVTAIVAGGYHSCALVNGGVKCWGRNNYGQLGDGSRTNRLSPVDVFGLASGVVLITAGLNHTCAVTGDHAMKCWGENSYGSLGDGTSTHRDTPVDVTGLTSGVTGASAGHNHTCAIVDGAAMCWGLNGDGQVGDNSGFSVRPTPVAVSGLAASVVSISAGGRHTCAIVGADGAARCWGLNTSGQVGDGTNNTRRAPVDVLVDENVAPPVSAANGIPPKSGTAPEPVNTATGNYFHQCTDLEWAGRGLGFRFTRTYNARSDYFGPLGHGWTHNLNLYLVESAADGSVVVSLEDGRELFFDSLGGGDYVSRYPGVYERLTKASGFTLTKKDHTRVTFDLDGTLTSITDRNGNALELVYSGGHLASVTDSVGRVFAFEHDGTGRLVGLTDPAGRKVTFAYDSNANLIQATDVRGFVTGYDYDDVHRLTSITDRRGVVAVRNTYDIHDRVASQTNGRGLETVFTYDAPTIGDTSITDALGNVVVHAHDDQFRLVGERDGLGQWLEYEYDERGNRSTLVDRRGQKTTFTYDGRGNILAATDPLGHVATFTYDADDNLTQRRDAAGSTFRYAYDAHGNLLTVSDAMGAVTTLEYDSHGQAVSLTDALGRKTHAAYDPLGNLVRIEDALGATTHLAYDTAARLARHTNPLGNTTKFTYDAADNVLSVVTPLGQATTYAYDGNGNRTHVTDARGATTTHAYNENNWLISRSDAVGGMESFAYDAADRRSTTIDQRGNVTTFGHDAAGRMTGRADALGRVTQFNYDANGNLTAIVNPLGKATTYSYDALGRRTSSTDALGHISSATYDAVGRLTSFSDANGRTTTYAYDGLGRRVRVTDAAGGIASYAYDAVGNRTQVTDPNGHVTTFAYDARGRLVTRTDSMGGTWHYVYDTAGRRVGRVDAKGAITAYSYDADDRLVAIDYPESATINFAYDPVGNRVAVGDGLGSSSYEYDMLNRLVRSIDAFGHVVTYAYDAAGNRTSIGYPGAKQVTYSHDALNRLVAVSDWLAHATQYAYDQVGNLETVFLPNGTTTDYVYDDAQRLVALVNARADRTFIAGYSIGLDPVGNPVQITQLGPLAPILSSVSIAYGYDSSNRLTSLDGTTATSDSNGNQTSQSATTYAYDPEDRLVEVSGGTAQYRYDGMGLRREAMRWGGITRYVLDVGGLTSHVLMEVDDGGNPIAYYVHGLGLVSRITPAGDVVYYHYDPVGSTVALTNAAANVTDRYAYDPFGVVAHFEGTTPNPYRYVGRYGVMDEGNGLNFVRARYYRPDVGRFLTADPQLSDGAGTIGMHRYVYALDNPVRFVDVNGLSAEGGVWSGSRDVWDAVASATNAFSGELARKLAHRLELAGRLPSVKPYTEHVAARTAKAIGENAGLLFMLEEALFDNIGDILDHPEREYGERAFRSGLDVLLRMGAQGAIAGACGASGPFVLACLVVAEGAVNTIYENYHERALDFAVGSVYRWARWTGRATRRLVSISQDQLRGLRPEVWQ
jgi:RHS repeat-associated protein